MHKCVHVCVSISECAQLHKVPTETRRGYQIIGAGVADSCELSDVGAGNITKFHCKRNICSEPPPQLINFIFI